MATDHTVTISHTIRMHRSRARLSRLIARGYFNSRAAGGWVNPVYVKRPGHWWNKCIYLAIEEEFNSREEFEEMLGRYYTRGHFVIHNP